MEEKFETRSSAPPISRSRFAHDVEQLLGDNLDLDPLFFEESWTVGKSIALENLHRRRQWEIERQSHSRDAWEVDDIQMLVADRAAPIAGSRDVTQAWGANQAAASHVRGVSSESWTPHDWIPLDRVRQSWIPEGWMPEIPTHDDETLQQQPCAEPGEDSMTLSRAQKILDITSTNTREQLRSAYRRRVIQCHPDRLQDGADADRRHATQQMAAINEAYHLLCSAMLQAA